MEGGRDGWVDLGSWMNGLMGEWMDGWMGDLVDKSENRSIIITSMNKTI
jgi:hypothetical protein